jgi:energy-coupling factor transporter ATPase
MKFEESVPLIRIRNLHYEYRNEDGTSLRALKGIDLEIQEGEYVVLVGANGSGKSTLLLHLNALLLPTEGDVEISGWSTRDALALVNIRSTVGMVFQSPDTQIIASVVEEEVAFGPENIGVPEHQLDQRVNEALQAVGLVQLRKRPSRLLSAGQKQLLVIASTLSMQPRCLALDEATSMLDPASRRQFLERVKNLNREGMTILSATHNMDEAALAQRMVVLSDGRVVADSSPLEIFSRKELLREARLELPSSLKLAQKVGERLPRFRSSALSVDVLAEEIDQYLCRKDWMGS